MVSRIEQLSPEAVPTPEILSPSPSAAWFIAVLCAGGAIKKTGEISFQTKDELFSQIILETGTEVLGVPAHYSIIPPVRNRPETHYVRFNSKRLAYAIGDVRQESWPDTILSRHPWILDYPGYTWAFLKGYFDTNGSVTHPGEQKHQVHLSVSREPNAMILETMLRSVRIENIHRHWRDAQHRHLTGILVGGIEEVHRFARGIGSSYIPSKNERLRYYLEKPLSVYAISNVRFSAYDAVMKLWQSGEYTKKELLQHPIVQHFNLDKNTIDRWIYKKNNPRRLRNRILNPIYASFYRSNRTLPHEMLMKREQQFMASMVGIPNLPPTVYYEAIVTFQHLTQRLDLLRRKREKQNSYSPVAVKLTNREQKLRHYLYALSHVQTSEQLAETITEIERYFTQRLTKSEKKMSSG